MMHAALQWLQAASPLRPAAPRACAIGFSRWKHGFVRSYFRDERWTFLSTDVAPEDLQRHLPALEPGAPGHRRRMLAWGRDIPDAILDAARRRGVRVDFVEDGFLRSRSLGATKAWPLSLCVDRLTPHFDAARRSDLETLLGETDFDADPGLMHRARRGIHLMLRTGLSKYNHVPRGDLAPVLHAGAGRKRVLVIGQVEDDASIRHGCARRFTNRDLIRLAVNENPQAQILYKPHPDVSSGLRLAGALAEPDPHCTVLQTPVPIAQALEGIDHVYTISSLAGFEALLRGIRVTAVGAPFYSGWGLTDDRQPTGRRRRGLTVEQIFAGAYLLYPRYFDPRTGGASSFEAVAALLCGQPSQADELDGALPCRPGGRAGIIDRHAVTSRPAGCPPGQPESFLDILARS